MTKQLASLATASFRILDISARDVSVSLTAEDAKRLIEDGVIDAGMIPKVEACLETLGRGVRKIHIVDGRLRHSLLLEIFTTSGVGTEIRQ